MVKGSAEKQVKKVRLPRSLGGLVAEASAIHGYEVLFLDNFENLHGKRHGKEAARSVAELLKPFSDRSAEAEHDVKAVVAGIPIASEELIALDPATARRTSQLEVDRMPEAELEEILVQGGSKLGIDFEGFGRGQIVQASDGFPYYTHLFGLHCARRARSLDQSTVLLDDFEAALDEILADCHLSLQRSYEKAVETTGEVKTRKTIMEALAGVNELEIPFRRIREGFLSLHPNRYESVAQLNFLTPAIAELKNMGAIEDRDLPKSPNNLYRFNDPLMRAYVRLRQRLEKRPTLI